jgi:hypothetical protein
MAAEFTTVDAQLIAAVLKAEAVTEEGDHFRIKLVDPESKRSLTVQVYGQTSLGKKEGMLVVVYTGNSHLQLHNCTGYVVSDGMGEVTFVAEDQNRLSGLVVERGASCSLYAALDRDLISSDFTQLGPEVMLSGVALSLAEDILSQESDSKDEG